MRLTLYCSSLSFVLINVYSKSYNKPLNIPPTEQAPQIVPYYTLKMQESLCHSRTLYITWGGKEKLDVIKRNILRMRKIVSIWIENKKSVKTIMHTCLQECELHFKYGDSLFLEYVYPWINPIKLVAMLFRWAPN